MYPPLPESSGLRRIPLNPITDKWVVVPRFIKGVTAIMSRDFVFVDDLYLQTYNELVDPWIDACFDACDQLKLPRVEASYHRPEVITRAQILLDSKDWWAVG